MNKLPLYLLMLNSMLVMNIATADDAGSNNTKAGFPSSPWVSTGPDDNVSVQNGAGISIVVLINVDRANANSPGATIKNCGTTTHIAAGSSSICTTNDANNPITISSDTSGKRASGSYQIKQQ